VTGKEAPDLGQQMPFLAAAWSPTSAVVALQTSRGGLLLWEPGSGREPRRLTAEDSATFAASFSADGKLVASGGERRFRIWDVAKGEEVRTVEVAAERGGVPLAFAPDGRGLAVWCGNTITLFDSLTGKELLSLRDADIDPVNPGPVFKAAFTPDGRALVVPARDRERALRVWEVATGKERRRVPLEAEVESLALSPNGTAAVGDYAGKIHLYDLGKAKMLRVLSGHEGHVHSVAYSVGGKLLASGASDHTVRLWDPDTGRELRRLEGHAGEVYGLAFSPDGKFLVSAGYDGTALVWDVAAALNVRAAPSSPAPMPRSLEDLWADLADEDATRAYAAIHALTERPGEAVALVKERLRPVAAPDARGLERLLADLDSERFETRDWALKELQALDRFAEPALRKALEGKPSPGVRRAVEGLLSRLEKPVTDPEGLRVVRAIEALEAIGTPEARRLLDAFAAGAPGVRLTEEARAASRRLSRRSSAPR
jgi:hypothetical protein